MNLEDLKATINLALDAINDVPEIYKSEILKIILIKLLEEKSISNPNLSSNSDQINDPKPKLSFSSLAKFCNLNESDLKNVIVFDKKTIEIICRVNCKDVSPLIVGSLILLLSHEILFNSEWVKSSVIVNTLKNIAIYDKGGNFSTYLKNRSDLFLKHANLNEYRLTTNNGRAIAIKIITKLSKNEEITKDDLKIN